MLVDEHQSLARRYVRWLRSRKPDATPAQIITTLERRYILATSTVGGANAVAGLLAAFTVGRITDRRLPFGTRLAAKAGVGLGVTSLLNAGDERIQFEVTAVYVLAVAEVHGMRLSKRQAVALVLGMTDADADPARLAQLIREVSDAPASRSDASAAGRRRSTRETAVSFLARGGAQRALSGLSLASKVKPVRVIGQLAGGTVIGAAADAARSGAGTYLFGRSVVTAVRAAFPSPPRTFPRELNVRERRRTH